MERRQLEEELLIWLPLVVVNDRHPNLESKMSGFKPDATTSTDLLLSFIRFKSKYFVDCNVVFALVGGPIYGLHPADKNSVKRIIGRLKI